MVRWGGGGGREVVRKRKHRTVKRPEYRRTQATWGGSSSKVQGWPRPRMRGQVVFSASRFPQSPVTVVLRLWQVEESGGVLVVEIGRLFLEFPDCEGERYP